MRAFTWAERERLLEEIATALGEVYTPAGVLVFWSSRISYLDDQRPCDVYRDIELLERLAQRVRALANGAFS